jgi:HEAT repeat protein
MLTTVIIWLTIGFAFFLLLLSAWLLIRKSFGVLRQGQIDAYRKRYQAVIPPLLLTDTPIGPAEESKRAWQRAIAFQLAAASRSFETGALLWRGVRYEAAQSVLEELSGTVSGETRDRIAYLFEQFGFVRRQIANLSDRRWWVRGEAARRLGIMRSRQALPALVKHLHDREKDVRLSASDSLLDIAGVKGALHQVLQNLTTMTLWMGVQLSKRVIAAGPAAIGPLLAGLESPVVSVRRFAIRMLGELRAPEVIGPLYTRFGSLDRETQILALRTLGRCGDEKVLDLLLQNTESQEVSIRTAAATALGYLGAPTAVPRLKQTLQEDRLPVGRAAAAALASIRPAGIHALIAVADAGTGHARALALEALDESSFDEAVQ